jgi:ribokinase
MWLAVSQEIVKPMSATLESPQKRSSVLTVGSAMIDTIAVIDDALIERMSMNNADRAFLLLEEGRKTEASIISTHPGGGAINSAVAFARLGFTVTTLIKLGRDARAQAIQDALAAEGVSPASIVDTDAAGTGASVLISAHERNAAIFTFRGANSFLELSDVARTAFSQDIVYITGLSNQSAEVFPDIVDRASARGAFVASNPGIRQLAARGDAFQKALLKISLLSMNREEAATLLPRLIQPFPKPLRTFVPPITRDTPDLMRSGLSGSGFEMALSHFCEALLTLGPQCILVTDGKRGAYAAVDGEIIFCPSLATSVVGTAGAGDAFFSTFTAHYANGTEPGEALQYAATNASSVVEFADTQSGLLTRKHLDHAFEKNKHRLPLSHWTAT